MGGRGEDELTKDVGCVACQRLLDPTCKGHLVGINCVNFIEREDRKNERSKKGSQYGILE